MKRKLVRGLILAAEAAMLSWGFREGLTQAFVVREPKSVTWLAIILGVLIAFSYHTYQKIERLGPGPRA